jgi:hypothetical protein
VWLARAVTAAALFVGLPLFLRSPPWCDITLYQMAARNLVNGGVHYRDIFDTNLPGFVWVMTALYSVFGPNVVAVRVLDLLIVLGVVLLIDRLAKWGGATAAARWWAFAGAALFYPFTVEMAHAQRDTWMALPALVAVALRVRRGVGPPPGSAALAGSPNPFRAALAEGILWGAGVWVKPHVALIAPAVWLLTAWRLAAAHPRPWRAAALDLAGNVAGGLAVGLAGVAWLVGSGAWDTFYEVFTEWNPRYMKIARQEFDLRAEQELFWFPVWSLGLAVTVPLAVLSVADAAFWSGRRADGEPARPGPVGRWLPGLLWDKRAGADARFARGALAGLYLAWAAQAFFVQRNFQYVHVPETLLMLGVWASHRWAWAPVAVLWLGVASGLWVAADYSPDLTARLNRLPPEERERFLPRHPIALGSRLKLWPECWRPNMTDAERFALWDGLRLHPPHEAAIGWGELGEVADYLRARGARDGEVVGWFDSPHAVYLLHHIDPGLRYMHVYTAVSICVEDEGGGAGRDRVLAELRAARPRPKYVVSDLGWLAFPADAARREALLGPPRSPDNLLPAAMATPAEFPFNQPTLFRSRGGTGRYVVHLIKAVADDPAPGK